MREFACALCAESQIGLRGISYSNNFRQDIQDCQDKQNINLEIKSGKFC